MKINSRYKLGGVLCREKNREYIHNAHVVAIPRDPYERDTVPPAYLIEATDGNILARCPVDMTGDESDATIEGLVPRELLEGKSVQGAYEFHACRDADSGRDYLITSTGRTLRTEARGAMSYPETHLVFPFRKKDRDHPAKPVVVDINPSLLQKLVSAVGRKPGGFIRLTINPDSPLSPIHVQAVNPTKSNPCSHDYALDPAEGLLMPVRVDPDIR